MSLEPQESSEQNSEAGFGSLRACLVEGDGEQRRGERCVRRRALAVSIVLQSAVLATLVLVPLFGKAERIALAIVTPIPPYSPYRNVSQNPGAPRLHPRSQQNQCRFCAPTNIPPTIVMHDPSGNEREETPFAGLGPGIPGAPPPDPRPRAPERENIDTRIQQPRVLHVTHLDPATLIHRVEPVYPPLARQTRREGRVELRAIIGTDGSIQSLQVVSGDALFLLSAREAVQQWKYKPTYLNGQAVEIDTYITVLFTMQH